MAQSHDSERGSNGRLLKRRTYLSAVGASAVAGVAGGAGQAQGATVIDLGAEGLQDGDVIDPYLDEYFVSGNEVHIPSGSYQYGRDGGSSLQKRIGNAALIGSADGVEFHRPSDPEHRVRPFIRATGDIRVENITVRGEKGEAPSRWRFDAVDPNAVVDVVNVNHPDGTVGCSDSLAFYTGKYHEGTVNYKNCYAADMGNSAFYINQGWDPDRQNPVNMINCVVVNSANTRHGTNGGRIRDCTFVWREAPPPWINCRSLARGPRWDQGGTDMLVENCHFYFGSDIGSALGCLQFEDFTPMGGVVRDVFVHTEGDYGGIVDSGGMGYWDFQNIHLTGPGNTNHGDYDGYRHEQGPDLRNENAIWMPESETVRPQPGSSSGGSSGGTDPFEGSMFEIVSTDSDAELEYTFDVDGTAEKAEASADNSSLGEANDTITDNGDGTVSVHGKTGFGFGDAFLVDGEITGFERTAGQSGFALYLDGEDVTDQLTAGGDGGGSSSMFEIVSTDSDAELEYAFDVDGTAEKAEASADNSSLGEANDTITDNGDGTVSVHGKTGFGFGDAFLVDGGITGFERTAGQSGFALYLDGEDVTDQLTSGSTTKRVYVDGTAAPEEVNEYRIEVSGAIQADPDNTTLVDGGLAWDALDDIVDDQTVVGVVGNGVDAYTFTGEIVDITVQGNATHHVES